MVCGYIMRCIKKGEPNGSPFLIGRSTAAARYTNPPCQPASQDIPALPADISARPPRFPFSAVSLYDMRRRKATPAAQRMPGRRDGPLFFAGPAARTHGAVHRLRQGAAIALLFLPIGQYQRISLLFIGRVHQAAGMAARIAIPASAAWKSVHRTALFLPFISQWESCR